MKTIKIKEDLYKQLEDNAKKYEGWDSTEEYITHILEQIVIEKEPIEYVKEEESTRQKLEELGYIKHEDLEEALKK